MGGFAWNSGNATYGQQANGNNATLQRVPRTSTTSGNTSTIKCYNCNDKGHLARVCPKPMVRDSYYFKEQMLLAKKYEAQIDLNDEEYDFLLADVPDEEVLEEFNATCIIMARLQSVNSDSDAGPSYDSDFANEVHDSQTSFINDMFAKSNHEQSYHGQTKSIKPTYDDDQIDSNIIFDDPDVEDSSENDEQDNNVHDQKNDEFELLIKNVQLEAEKTYKINKAFKEEND
ncbi:retrovirus-related pol polyprotein from transposon TNT 1-94 [Tanacetum coccineum]